MSTAESQREYFGRDLEAMSFAVNYHRWILREFNGFIGQHLLEVGAGTGNFSRLLLEKNPATFVTIEPSSNMYPLLVRALENYPNGQTINGVFADHRESLAQQPDTIFYVNVLEHILDDRAELTYVHQSLSLGGHVCLFVPALQWLYGTADANLGHVRRYHKPALKQLVHETGFEIVKSRYFDLAGIVPWWILFRLLKTQSLRPRQVSLYDSAVVPVMRVLERGIAPPIGKNLLMVGKKR